MNASTVVLYDISSKQSRFKKTGINPQSVFHDDNTKRWFVQYAHLTTMPDSVGGLIILDESLNQIAHYRGHFIGTPIKHKSAIHALQGKAIVRLQDTIDKVDTVFVNMSRNQWYRIGAIQNRLYICNARNYTLPGTIMFLNDQSNGIIREVAVGINPSIVIDIE